MTKRIYVSPGRYALVDDDDAERIAAVDWSPVFGGRTTYARTNSTKIGASQRSMHRLVMRAAVGTVVDHINGEGLDNRKENLRIVTTAENAQNRFGHARFATHKTKDQVQLTPFQLPPAAPLHPLKQTPRMRRLARFQKAARRQAEIAAMK